VFSVEANPRLYNEPAEIELRDSLDEAVEDDGEEKI
jgi:hypothetical protein